MSISAGLKHNFRRFSTPFSLQDVCMPRLGNSSTIKLLKIHYHASDLFRSVQNTLSCGEVILVRLNRLGVSEQITGASCINSLLLAAVWKSNTLFFIKCWNLKLQVNFWKGQRRMARLESSLSDLHLSSGGNAVANGHSGLNDDFQKDVCNIDACQGEASSSPREECLTRQIQMENSGNSIFHLVLHAKSSSELEYIRSLEQENSLKLPEGEIVISTRSKQQIVRDDECFNLDLYMDNLSTNQFGRLLIWSPRLSSTHTLLSKNFYAFPVGTTCVADIQLQGKGRGNNLWESPRGCLMFSFTLQMDNGRILPLLQYVVCLAIIDAIEAVCDAKLLPPPNVRIKWPNDIYAEGLKIGGVLCTSTYSSKKFNVTVGIGLNLDNDKPTTCLNSLLQKLTTNTHLLRKEELLVAFFGKFEVLLDVFLKQGFSTLESKYCEKWLHSEQKVLLEEGQEQNHCPSSVFVTVKGLTSSGYLLAVDDENNKYELHPDGNSYDFFKGLVRRKLAE